MLFQLKCGCVMRWPSRNTWPIFANYQCENDHGWSRLVAVECREWKMRCTQCKYGRWTGASKSQAVELGNRHARGGHKPIEVDFLVHPSNKTRARCEYGTHRVRLWVDKTMPDSSTPHVSDPDTDPPPF